MSRPIPITTTNPVVVVVLSREDDNNRKEEGIAHNGHSQDQLSQPKQQNHHQLKKQLHQQQPLCTNTTIASGNPSPLRHRLSPLRMIRRNSLSTTISNRRTATTTASGTTKSINSSTSRGRKREDNRQPTHVLKESSEGAESKEVESNHNNTSRFRISKRHTNLYDLSQTGNTTPVDSSNSVLRPVIILEENSNSNDSSTSSYQQHRDLVASKMRRRNSASGSSHNTTTVNNSNLSENLDNKESDTSINPSSAAGGNTKTSDNFNCMQFMRRRPSNLLTNDTSECTTTNGPVAVDEATRTNKKSTNMIDVTSKSNNDVTGPTRYPSSPFRLRRRNSGLLAAAAVVNTNANSPSTPTTTSSLTSQHLQRTKSPRRFKSPRRAKSPRRPKSPRRRIIDKLSSDDDVQTRTDNVAVIEDDTTDQLHHGTSERTTVSRLHSPTKRRRTPSRSPSNNLRNNLMNRLKSAPLTGDDASSSAQPPVVNVIPDDNDKPAEGGGGIMRKDPFTDGRAGLLQRKNSVMSIHSNYDIDDSKNVSFGSDPTNADHPLVEFSPPPEVPVTEDERFAYYYSKEDLEKFEKDRQLTLLYFRSQRDKGIPWEEGEYSLRGLEEYVFTAKMKSRRQVRKEHLLAILAEQARVRAASLSPEVATECLRSVSIQISKRDKNRAIALAAKDAKEAGHNISGRQLLMKKLKSLSKRSLWRATAMDTSDSRRSLMTDSKRSLMSEDSSRASVTSNTAGTGSSDEKSVSSPRAVSPVHERESVVSHVPVATNGDPLTESNVDPSPPQTSSPGQTYAAVRSQLRSAALTKRSGLFEAEPNGR